MFYKVPSDIRIRIDFPALADYVALLREQNAAQQKQIDALDTTLGQGATELENTTKENR